MEQDARFSHVATDPKFRRIPKGARKVKIDKRFQSMFKDKQFKVKYSVDKRGRPVNHTSTEDLKRYYDISSEDESDSGSEKEEATGDREEDEDVSESSNEESANEIDEETSGKSIEAPKGVKDTQKASNKKKVGKKGDKPRQSTSSKSIPNKIKKRLKDLNVDYARGEGVLQSDSSSSDGEDDLSDLEGSEDESGLDHGWGEMDRDASRTEESTRRLAICNMDWDRIRATDLMVLLNSFAPAGGVIESITIYPSEFGKKRMQEEELRGPTELVQNENTEEEQQQDQEETEEGSKYHMEKLRQYQLNRLKYYYAIAETDSPQTAGHIYEECDGMEYESTATKLDLRFVPDDTTFDEEEAKERCRNLPEKYEPRYFTTTALQQAKVQLTWDENDVERAEIAEKLRSGKIDDVSEADLQNYLASSSGEEDEEETTVKKEELKQEDDRPGKNSIDKYKLLLQEIVDKEEEVKRSKDIGLEISWGIDLKEKTDKLVKQKQAQSGETKTPFEEFLEKRKEKKKSKREAKLEPKKGADDEDDESSEDAPSDVDMNDPYFAEEFDKPEFKQKKKTKKVDKHSRNEDDEETHQKKAELELLLDDDDDGKKHFSLKKIQESEDTSKSKKKRFKKKNNKEVKSEGEDFTVNVADDRFSALYSSHHFNIDPTDSHYKKTKGMEALIEEKLKRRNEDCVLELESTGSKKQKIEQKQGDVDKSKAELSVLVKSIKRKTEAMQNKKKKK